MAPEGSGSLFQPSSGVEALDLLGNKRGQATDSATSSKIVGSTIRSEPGSPSTMPSATTAVPVVNRGMWSPVADPGQILPGPEFGDQRVDPAQTCAGNPLIPPDHAGHPDGRHPQGAITHRKSGGHP